MIPVEQVNTAPGEPGLEADFVRRLQASLDAADRERRRVQIVRRLQAMLPVLLLIGPIVAWRLILVSRGTARMAIDMLAWITTILDVCVHVNSTLLSYLGLGALPTIVGMLVFAVLTASLLYESDDER